MRVDFLFRSSWENAQFIPHLFSKKFYVYIKIMTNMLEGCKLYQNSIPIAFGSDIKSLGEVLLLKAHAVSSQQCCIFLVSAGAQVAVRVPPPRYTGLHWLGSLSRSILSPKPKIPQKISQDVAGFGHIEFSACTGLIWQNQLFFI